MICRLGDGREICVVVSSESRREAGAKVSDFWAAVIDVHRLLDQLRGVLDENVIGASGLNSVANQKFFIFKKLNFGCS